jgi:hypothetical protein
MIIQITGVTSGVSPYDVYICDPTNAGCFLVSGNTNIPPIVTINSDLFFPNEQIVYVKLVDIFGCVLSQEVVCGGKIFQDDFGFSFMDDIYFVFQ